MPCGDGEQMQVVVAEHGHGCVAERLHLAQHVERRGTAIHEIADEPQPVLGRREADEVEELAELRVTALDVADRVEHRQTAVGRVSARTGRLKVPSESTKRATR